MKNLLYVVVFSFLSLPIQGQTETSEQIKAFFDHNHGELLDYYWVRPREIYNQWSNGSRFTTSTAKVKYKRKKVEHPIFEGLNDYIGDTPLSWTNTLKFHNILIQSYKKENLKVFNAYEVREEAGDLKIFHKNHQFAIGKFDKDGRYSYSGFYENTGGLNLEIWSRVFFDPWEGKMWYRQFLDKDKDKYTRTTYMVNADNFLFRFKGETRLQQGKLKIKKVAGFRSPISMFVFNGKKMPISKETDINSEWEEQTISFDIFYDYDERRLSVDKNGIVDLNHTREEFLAY